MDDRGWPIWLFSGAIVAVILIALSRPTPEAYRAMQARFATLAAADATQPPPDVAGATRTALDTTRSWLWWLGQSIRDWFDGGRSAPAAIPTSVQSSAGSSPSGPVPTGSVRSLAEGTAGPLRIVVTRIVTTPAGSTELHGTVTNVGPDPVTVPITIFTVIDSAGTFYVANGLEAPLQPGQATSLTLDVDLPPGRSLATLRVQWPNTSMLELSLAIPSARSVPPLVV